MDLKSWINYVIHRLIKSRLGSYLRGGVEARFLSPARTSHFHMRVIEPQLSRLSITPAVKRA